MIPYRRVFLIFALLLSASITVPAFAIPADQPAAKGMREMIERYTADRESVAHAYDNPLSRIREARFRTFYQDWQRQLATVNFTGLSDEGKLDYILFQNHLHHALRQLDLRKKQQEEMAPLIPFADIILSLDDSRRRMESRKPDETAASLQRMTKQIETLRAQIEAGLPSSTTSTKEPATPTPAVQPLRASRTVSRRAAATIAKLRQTLKSWFTSYNGYDPDFTWWVAEPYKEADQALEKYGQLVSEKLVGIKADDKITIVGDPIGRDALLVELTEAVIPYTPEELIALAKNEMSWCTKEMKRASNEMGFGDDWHKALEKVKEMHVPPGQQPEMIRGLALEATEYVEKNDLVTVPELAKESWRMEMMTPERQLVNPFFTGGDVISVSYPVDSMTFEQKMMSMRGNNIPFSRSTVFHELIPGHHLQAFMSSRYHTYREIFNTPFWVEGNAFYWEMLLWDMGFPKTPEQRVGMLFWRMHRCARVIFSLSFHLGLMTPQECVKFLIDNVGHEPDNATAEVRRSFDGSYGPLYQCAYLLGALQFYSLHKELVGSGRMTNRAFHDAILQENSIPVELIRADLTHQHLTQDFQSSWKFYGPIPAAD
ncbi:MAG TPA: DUF885 family protein [Candidatus Acidoferrum sp.]|nr:DUF885 family protein [Candidatus Acidoferrum sp.]